LENALKQREYNEAQTGPNIMAGISTVSKVKNFVKDYFPVLGVIKHQMSLLDKGEVNATEDNVVADTGKDTADYQKALEAVFAKLKHVFAGQIIVLYHPMVTLETNGEMTVEYSENLEAFVRCCDAYGIAFVNVGEDFLEDYENSYHVPYGFSNTTMGEGHINRWGHEVIARALYEEITGGKQE